MRIPDYSGEKACVNSPPSVTMYCHVEVFFSKKPYTLQSLELAADVTNVGRVMLKYIRALVCHSCK